jgi:hypothetical protein
MIIRPDKCASKLHERAEQWERGGLRSFALVTIHESGEIIVDFDIEDMKDVRELNGLGMAVAQLYEHLKTLRAQRFS